jgi:DNA-binding MarR family transcriptional regulator
VARTQAAYRSSFGAKRSTEDEAIVLGVLDSVERNPSVTQRSVAAELDIALGLANAYLKRCVRQGLIKVNQVPARRYAYYLTPQGFAEKSRLTANYFAHSFSFFRRARRECSALFAEAVAKGCKRIVLIGEGDLAEIAEIVAHEYPLEVVGTVAVVHSDNELAAEVAKLGAMDAVIITALVQPRGAFDSATAIFGSEKVYAPPLLRIPTLVAAKSLEAGQ